MKMIKSTNLKKVKILSKLDKTLCNKFWVITLFIVISSLNILHFKVTNQETNAKITEYAY